MRGYRIYEEDGRWFFELIPGNKGMQRMTVSCPYDREESCINAVKNLKEWIVSNEINSVRSPFVQVLKCETGTKVQYIKDGRVVLESRSYFGNSAMQNCKKCIATIYQNIEEYTSNRKRKGGKA